MKKQRTTEIPSTWDELTEDDWRYLLKLRHLMATTGHQWTADDARTETARMMLRQRGVRENPGNGQWLLLVGQIAQSLDWLWQEDHGALSLVYRSTRNLMPQVRHWVGPLSHGQDLMFGEFRQAMEHLRQWEQQQNPTALAALAGLLYRPRANERQRADYGDRQLLRQPYDWDSLDEKIRRGRSMKPWQQWGAYAWMAFFCEYLTTGVFIIDGCEMTFAPLFAHGKDGAQGADGTNGLQQICLTLAESHVFGTVRDVDRTPLLTVMQKLLQDYQTLMNLKKRQSK